MCTAPGANPPPLKPTMGFWRGARLKVHRSSSNAALRVTPASYAVGGIARHQARKRVGVRPVRPIANCLPGPWTKANTQEIPDSLIYLFPPASKQTATGCFNQVTHDLGRSWRELGLLHYRDVGPLRV